MTVLAAEILPALELEHDELLAAGLRGDLGRHGGALDQRLPDLRRVAADEEDLAKRDLVASAAGELLHPQLLTLGYPVLLAARLDDRVHDSPRATHNPAGAPGTKGSGSIQIEIRLTTPDHLLSRSPGAKSSAARAAWPRQWARSRRFQRRC